MKIASSGLHGRQSQVHVDLNGVLSFFRNQDPPVSPNGSYPVLWAWSFSSEGVEKPPDLPCSRSQANLTWETRACAVGTPHLGLGCRGHSRPVECQPEPRPLNDLRASEGGAPPENLLRQQLKTVCIASTCIGFLMGYQASLATRAPQVFLSGGSSGHLA